MYFDNSRKVRAGTRVPRGSSLPTDQCGCDHAPSEARCGIFFLVSEKNTISPTLGIVRIGQVSLSKNQNFEICNTS